MNAAASTFSAALLDSKKRQVIAPVSQSIATSGADWANGVLVVEFAASLTTGLTPCDDYFLEIQEITSAGKRRTYPHVAIEVQQGTIP